MKNSNSLLVIFLVMLFTGVSAQERVKQKVQQLEAKGTNFVHKAILSVDASVATAASQKAVTSAVYGKLNQATLQDIVTHKYAAIELEIPYINETLVTKLYRVDVFAEGFHIDTDKQENIEYTPGVYYRGTINGEESSVVSFSFFNNEFTGVASASRLGNVVVGKLNNTNATTDYIVYSDENLTTSLGFECFTDDNNFNEPAPSNTAGKLLDTNTTECATIYFEIDYDLYVANGNDTNNVANWLTAVFNNVQTLYDNDGITVALKSSYVWTTTDPYTGASSYGNLALFNNNTPMFDGDLGQLLGIDGGYGGVAATINGLCSDYNYSYSDVYYNYSTVPTFSWTIQVITHELGHLLGSRHTHACVWNGNNTAIDGCGPTYDSQYQEGSCAIGPIPSTTQKGTIMSYCHLISGVGISFNNGFGIQPSLAIIDAMGASDCLSTDCINTCINVIEEVHVTTVAETSLVVGWTDNGSQTEWYVSVVPYGTADVWVLSDTNSYTALNLTPNTYYTVKVKPACSGGLDVDGTGIITATNGDVCSGLTFTDTGGTTSNYPNNQTVVRTFIPTADNSLVKVVFNSFALETNYDFMYVYDGPDETYPLLTPDGISGFDVPGPFTSTAADGTLTFKFVSDPYLNYSGWDATVSCENTTGVATVDYVEYSYYPNPTTGSVTITSPNAIAKVTVYNTMGQLLYTAMPAAATTKVDLSKFATGTYFFTLDIDGTTATFKVMKQ